jgi:hypothetical protein
MLARHRPACAAILCLTAAPVWAGDVAVTAGASEAVALPQTTHLGLYPYAAVSLVYTYDHVSVSPSVGLEYSPDTGRWGFVGTVTLDVPITATVGGDVIVAVAHDQAGLQWRDALLLVGGGLGLSITTKQFVTSPSICIYTTVGSIAWSLEPGISVSHVF